MTTREDNDFKYEVQLAIYDLSQGMARALSAQFLGQSHAIDIIPHTAILAFGKEYYFGMSGVEASDPHHFRSTRCLSPIQIQHLGHTCVSKDEFEEWCRQHMQNGTYASHSYDLFHRNCNHFSHDATQKLGVSGVPDHILSVPQKVLSSPMGALLGPMLQQMQITPSGEGNSLVSNTSSNNNHGYSSSSKVHTVFDENNNPWASDVKQSPEYSPDTHLSTTMDIKTPILDSYHKPFIANDVSMVHLCVEKIKKGKGIQRLEPSNQMKLTDSLTALSNFFPLKEAGMKGRDFKNDIHLLQMILDCDESSVTEKTYVLMLLRLIVLQKETDSDTRNSIVLAMKPYISQKKLKSTTRAMAWCVVSNALGYIDLRHQKLSEKIFEAFVDHAIDSLSSDTPVEVRRGVAAFLFNLMLFFKKSDHGDNDLPDLHVTLLCSIGELISNESDVEVITRLFLVIGKIAKCNHKSKQAARLVSDLGFHDTFHAVVQCHLSSVDTKKVKGLVQEIIDMTKSD